MILERALGSLEVVEEEMSELITQAQFLCDDYWEAWTSRNKYVAKGRSDKTTVNGRISSTFYNG